MRLRAGVRAQVLDRRSRQVLGSDGSTVGYDTLVLATGSRSHVPPMPGLRAADGGLLPGAFTFRTVDDTRAIGAAARPGRHAVVLGGGLLGLEAARALQTHGLTVEVLHSGSHLMNTQLDADAGAVLRRSVEALGIGVQLGVRAEDVVGGDRVRGVRLADGRTVPAEVFVLTAGVRPETALAASAGLAVARGVLVDDQLGTDDPHVRAIGECAEHRGRVYGLVGPVWEQAAVLADVLTGADPLAEYLGSRTATKLKVAGLDVATMGAKEPDQADDEHVVVSEPRRGVHLSAVIRDGRLVGATLIGDTRRAAALTQAYDRGTPLPAERIRLLVGGLDGPAGDDVADLPADARVCHCNGVSKQDVCDAVAAGSSTVAAIKSSTRAGTGCGSCTGALAQLLDRAAGDGREGATVRATGAGG